MPYSRARRPLAALLAGVLGAGVLAALPAAPAAAQVAPSAGDRTVTFTAGGLQPLQPARLLDTRGTGRTVDGQSQSGGIVAAGTSRTLQVAGRGGVPEVGAGAVWLNVTVTQSAGAGHLTVHPFGTQTPNASNLNFTRGQTAPNLVLAKLGTDGKVELAAAASTHVLADVVGWVPEGRDVQALQPARVLDTRGSGRTVDSREQAAGAFAPSETRTLPLAGRAGVPATGVGAVVVNVTAVGPTRGGHLTVWPTGAARPNASSLNFSPGTITPNLVVAKVGADGSISIQNVGGSTSILADVVGWIPAESAYTALTPARVLDTRGSGATVDGQHKGTGALGAGETRRLPVAGRGGVPASGVGAVVVNLTGTQPSSGTHLTVFPSGSALPNASNLNLTRSATRANLVIAKVGADGAISIANAAGSTQVIADVVGWFPSGAASSNAAAPTGAVTMVLPPTTELAGAGDVEELFGTSAAPTSITLAAGADVPPVGGHLVVMPSGDLLDGTLARVNEVAPGNDGTTRLQVQRAAIPDAFVDLDITFKGPLVLEDRGTPTGTEAGLRRSTTGYQELGGQGTRSAERSREFAFGPATKAGFTCTGAATTAMSFNAEFLNSEAIVDYDLSDRYLKLLVTSTPTVTAAASLDGSGSCTREITLPGKLPLGPTGLFIAADLALDITATGHIAASASVGTPISMGFEYSRGAVTNLSSASYTGSATIAEEETQASLTITPTTEIDLEFLGIVEIGLLFGLPVTATVIPLSSPCATLDVAGTLGAEFELEFPILPDVEKEIGSFDLGSKRVFEGECQSETPPPPSGPRTPGTYSGSVLISGDQGPVSTRTEGTSRSVAFASSQTFMLENADLSPANELPASPGDPESGYWAAQVGEPGLPRPTTGEITSYQHSYENIFDCTASLTGLTLEPTTGTLILTALSADGRSLAQMQPGETVLVSLDGSFNGTGGSYQRTGDGPCAGGPNPDGAEGGFHGTPGTDQDEQVDVNEVGACPEGTTRRPSAADPSRASCTFPVVLGPDRSLVFERTISYNMKNYLKNRNTEDSAPDTTPVTFTAKFSLQFTPR